MYRTNIDVGGSKSAERNASDLDAAVAGYAPTMRHISNSTG
jgi:hypothetical protein